MTFLDMSIAQITSYVKNTEVEELPRIIDALSSDQRAGVQKLVIQLKKKLESEKKELHRLKKLYMYEKDIIDQGLELIAGIDEVGRGPLAGPVVAAAVILPKFTMIHGINDSKKLSQAKRKDIYQKIMEKAVSVGVGIINNQRIDEINILNATYEAMFEAVNHLEIKPEFILIDAVTVPMIPYPQRGIIKGDSKSISIAAASIVAKVIRDELMMQYHSEYNEYQFNKNKGYGTQEHINAIKNYGLTPIHRMSFTKNFQR